MRELYLSGSACVSWKRGEEEEGEYGAPTEQSAVSSNVRALDLPVTRGSDILLARAVVCRHRPMLVVGCDLAVKEQGTLMELAVQYAGCKEFELLQVMPVTTAACRKAGQCKITGNARCIPPPEM